MYNVDDIVVVDALNELLVVRVAEAHSGHICVVEPKKRTYENSQVVSVVKDGVLSIPEGTYETIWASQRGIKRLDCHKVIIENLVDLRHNPIKSMIGFPEYVGDDLDCEGTECASLQGCPDIVESCFTISGKHIRTWKYLPIKVGRFAIRFEEGYYDRTQAYSILIPLCRFDVSIENSSGMTDFEKSNEGIFRTKLSLIQSGNKQLSGIGYTGDV